MAVSFLSPYSVVFLLPDKPECKAQAPANGNEQAPANYNERLTKILEQHIEAARSQNHIDDIAKWESELATLRAESTIQSSKI